MGQRFPTDLAALEAAASTIWELALTRVFTDETAQVELLRPLPDRSLTAPSFQIEFQLQQDVLDPGGDRVRTMVVLAFFQRDYGAYPGWKLFVRGDWPDRTDRLARVGVFNARRLRKALSPRRHPPGAPHRFAVTNDDLYLMKTTPLLDVTAQLCLLVLQTDLSCEAAVMDWLTTYIVAHFTKSDGPARAEIAQEIVLRLMRNKWWMEDPRAWRRYLAVHRRVVRRAYFIQRLERTSKYTDRRPRPLEPPTQRSRTASTTDGISVQEAARILGVSTGTVYAQIHDRRLPLHEGPGPFLIPRSEVERLASEPRLREVIAAVAAARGCRFETARRRVSRLRQTGLTLGQVLHDAQQISATLELTRHMSSHAPRLRAKSLRSDRGA